MSQQQSFITLEQLSHALSKHINQRFGANYYWIVGEISGLNIRKGHCYLSLIDKDPDAIYPKAEFSGLIWRTNFESIHNKFKKETNQALRENIKILFKAKVVYDNKFGISLHIEDIEPGYTLGQMELDRQMVIKKLKQEGIYDLNKRKTFPLVPQRLAVISNTESKGFEDFADKITNNPWGYQFSFDLYPSLLQGEKAASDIRSKLIAIFHEMDQRRKRYDAVLILRGGGANTSLNCYNNYELAKAVARFPIPIVTGIGHTTNISVVDEIAKVQKNTPTDVADYLLRLFREYDISISKTLQSIASHSKRIVPLQKEQLSSIRQSIHFSIRQGLTDEKTQLKQAKTSIISRSKQVISSEREEHKWIIKQITKQSKVITTLKHKELEAMSNDIQRSFRFICNNEKLNLKNIGEKLHLLDPIQTLKRGFSITTLNGQSIKETSHLKPGDLIETRVMKGIINSEIKEIN